MDINITLLGEMLTFAVLVWVTMKFIWPPMLNALNERQKKIADGLEAGERGRRELELTQSRIGKQLREVKTQAAAIMEQANQRASTLVEDAKHAGQLEGERMLKLARDAVQHEIQVAKRDLQKQVARLAVVGTERILEREVDAKTDQKLLDDLLEEL